MSKVVLNLKNYINKPKIDWVAMKVEAFKRLDENNRIREADAAFRDLYPRIGDHVYKTVEKLITLYRKKFDKGQLGNGFKLRFTYSYFKQHADSRYCIRTFINHFNKLADAYQSIFKIKDRDVLQLPGRDCNCVMVEFAPGIVQYTNPEFNKLHDMTIPPQFSSSSPPMAVNAQVFHNPIANEHQFFERGGGGAKRISKGDLLGSLFKGR